MSRSSPLVSVVIPAYNAEATIEKTICSVLDQTYQHFEVLVIDDGSCDRTPELVTAIVDRDHRVSLFQQANAGVAAARNLGIQHAKGELIAPLDADDIWYPQNLEKQVDCILAAGDKVGLVYSWSIIVDEFDQPTGSVHASRIEGKVYTTLLLHDFIANASSVMIRKSCLDRVGGYDPTLKQQRGQGGEDWDLHLRIARQYEFQVVPNFLVGYRKSSGSMSTDSQQMARSRSLIWRKIRQQHHRAPRWLERLSNSSFYLHLASQNYHTGRDQAALRWIVETLKVDPVTPFLRPGFYRITVLSLLRVLLPRRSNKLSAKVQNRSGNASKAVPPPLLPQQRRLTQPKVLGEMLLHWCASPLFGTAERWL